MDWDNFGKQAFGGLHTAGKIVLSAFGAGQAGEALERVESPYLPDWAKSPQNRQQPTQSAQPQPLSPIAPTVQTVVAETVIGRPDFVVVSTFNSKPTVYQNVSAAIVRGGDRFEGNGYKKSDGFGKTFSFGYTAPAALDLAIQGKRVQLQNVQQVIFLGGTEQQQQVIVGDDGRIPMSDYLYGTDVLGAAPPQPKKPTVPKAPVGKSKPGKTMVTRRSTNGVSPHLAVLDSSGNVAARAKGVARAAVARAERRLVTKVKGEFVEVLGSKSAEMASDYAEGFADGLAGKPQGTTFFGLLLRKGAYETGYNAGLAARHTDYHPVIGAATAVIKTPKKLTGKQQAAIAKRDAASKQTKLAAEKAKRAGERALEAANQLEAARTKAAPVIAKVTDKPTRVRGDEILGIEPDPWNPGFLTDGTPDPNYAGGGGTEFAPPSGDALMPPYDPTKDPDLIPIPVRGVPLDLAYVKDNPWPTPPADAIFFPESMNPWTYKFDLMTGSANYFLSDGKDGFIWANEENQYWAYRSQGGTRRTKDDGKGGDIGVNQTSLKYGWGPLVGNPKGKYGGFQMSVDNKWFALPENAPKWAVQDADRQIEILNKQIMDTNRKAVEAWNARVLQEQREAAEAQAAAEAAAALAQTQAEAEAAVQAQQIATQQAQTQAALEQAQAQFLQQHPEYMFPAPQPAYGSYGGQQAPIEDGYYNGDQGNVDWGDAAPRDGYYAESSNEEFIPPPPDPMIEESQVDWEEGI